MSEPVSSVFPTPPQAEGQVPVEQQVSSYNGITPMSSAAAPAQETSPSPTPPAAGAASNVPSGSAATGGEARQDPVPAAAAAAWHPSTQGDPGSATAAAAAAASAGADGAAKKEGGSQPQPRSAKRPRDNPLPVGLPKSMVRRIMKLGEETRNISNEALVMVVKASEIFLEKFAAKAFDHAEKLGRRTIKYRDVSDVRLADPNLLFLEAVVPP